MYNSRCISVGIKHFNINNNTRGFTVVFIIAVGLNSNMSAYRSAAGFILRACFLYYYIVFKRHIYIIIFVCA